MKLLTAVPYLMGTGALLFILIGCCWKQIMKLFNKEGNVSTQFAWSIGALVLMPMALSLNYEIGYNNSFPTLESGQTATVLAIYHPDFKHNEQKIPREKRCLVRLKDGRETIIKESEFYFKEMDDIEIGDVVIQEIEGSIYVLRHINIHRTIPYSRPASIIQSPIVDQFADNEESIKKEILP